MTDKDLGIVTAYGYAVEKGYTGTEEEFAALMADYAAVGQRAEQSAAQAAASATAASGSAGDSAASATAAEGFAGNASTAAGNAAQAASQAAQSATQAAGSATTAGTAATNAQAAQTAAEAAQTAAEAAQTAAETAQGAAEDAAESVEGKAAQIDQNTADISQLKSQLEAKQDAPSTAGTAGQVLGLDSNLTPVWVNQSGGGGETWHEAVLSEADYDSTLKMIVFDAGSGNQVKDVILMGQIVNDGTQTANEKISFGVGITVNRYNYSCVGQTDNIVSTTRRVGFSVQFSVRMVDETYRMAFPQVLLYGSSNNVNHALSPDQRFNMEGTKQATNQYPNFNDPRYVKIELPTWIPEWAYIKVLYTLA